MGHDAYKLPNCTLDDFTNHSCDPNTGIRLTDRGMLILALRDIVAHEELTYDYSTYLNNPYESLHCLCGAANCRGVIGNFSTLPAELQAPLSGARHRRRLRRGADRDPGRRRLAAALARMIASARRAAAVPGRRWFGLAGERLSCLLHFMALAITLAAAKVIFSTIGVALFLAKEGPAQLPLFYLLLAAVAILLSAALGGVVDRVPRIALGQMAFLGTLLGAAALRLLIALDLPAVYYAVLASAHIFEIVVDIVFWVVVAAFLDTLELKRGTPLIYMALAAGGVAGGALTTALSPLVSTEDLLLALPALGAIAAAQFGLARRRLRSCPIRSGPRTTRRGRSTPSPDAAPDRALSADPADRAQRADAHGPLWPVRVSGVHRLCRELRTRPR